MLITSIVVGVFSIAMTAAPGMSFGQSYPNKPIRIVTTGIGSSTDFASRIVAQGISSPLGQPVIVDNRGINAMELVGQALPDGYTLLAIGGQLWIGPLLRKASYDAVRDFSPIAMLVSSPNLVAVHPSVPIRSVKELIAVAKSKPGELNYASGATGSSNHLAAELFKAMAGVSVVRISYKGAGPAVNAAIAGEVQVIFPSAASATLHVKSGRLSALAVTSAQPSALFQDLPTVAATGLPGYEAVAMEGVFAPAKTPATLIKRLHEEILKVLIQPDVKKQFFSHGVEVVGSSPSEFASKIKSEMTRLGKVIKGAGISAD